jgi:hypothetical protein
MDSERAMWQGLRQEKLDQVKKLEISISALRSSIRIALNPHSPVSEINHELVTQQTFEMADKLIQHERLSSEIEAINKSLGI